MNIKNKGYLNMKDKFNVMVCYSKNMLLTKCKGAYPESQISILNFKLVSQYFACLITLLKFTAVLLKKEIYFRERRTKRNSS